MKLCLVCGTAATDDQAVCVACGEASWSNAKRVTDAELEELTRPVSPPKVGKKR